MNGEIQKGVSMKSLRSASLCVLTLAFLLQAGCEPGLPSAGQDSDKLRPASLPDWADKQNWAQDGRKYFVGRALADHPLDEKNALDEALNHAIQNIATVAGSQLNLTTQWSQREGGDPGFGDTSREYSRNTRGELTVEGLVVNIQQEKVYWDRIKDSVITWQYRYFVLVSIAEQDFSNLVDQIKKKRP